MAALPPGWFGKMASLGDFASRRMTPEWVQACDTWLSAGVDTSRQQLGDQWLATYLAAPVWRFAWAPNVVDAQWWFGVLMPSCDRVGRYFPLIVAQPRALPPADRFGLAHLDLWWTRLAQVAMRTLDDAAHIETFEAELADLPDWPAVRTAASLTAPVGASAQLTWPAGTTLDELAHSLAADSLQRRLHGHSLWCPWRAEAPASPCHLVPGLPGADAFAQILFAPG